MAHRDSTASEISLQLVDPAPVPDSRHSSVAVPSNQPPPPPASSGWASALGLTGSGHSSVYYCSWCSVIAHMPRLICNSNPSPKILILRFHRLCLHPLHQHISHSTCNPLSPNIRTIPPPHTTNLPVLPSRATSRYPPNCNTCPRWTCSPNP